MDVKDALAKLPSFSSELGIDLKKPEGRFLWFLASLLFAKRISANVAKRAFNCFLREGLTTPTAILTAGWSKLVEVLDSGGYVRYDFSTASAILETMNRLMNEYGGDVDRVHDSSLNPEDLERKIMEFKGFGPVATNIFLRELRGIWRNARPKPSKLALEVARKIKVKEVEEFEPQLVRINLDFCKRSRCEVCPVVHACS